MAFPCDLCGKETKVVESSFNTPLGVLRRRRACECGRRFNTWEIDDFSWKHLVKDAIEKDKKFARMKARERQFTLRDKQLVDRVLGGMSVKEASALAGIKSNTGSYVLRKHGIGDLRKVKREIPHRTSSDQPRHREQDTHPVSEQSSTRPNGDGARTSHKFNPWGRSGDSERR